MAEQFQFFMDKASLDFAKNLEQRVTDLLKDKKLTVSVAESVTGGLVCKMLTSIPGSSEYFIGGAVCYSPRAKVIQAGLEPKSIAKYGVVSEEMALGLARGIRQRLLTTIGIGVTGVAGPNTHGGKPVGTVYIAIAEKEKEIVKEFSFEGGREEIQKKAAQAVFSMLWLYYRDQQET